MDPSAPGSSSDQNGTGTGSNNPSSSQVSSSTDPAISGGVPANTEDFSNTGRTGRRNALGDILDQTSAFLTTADLPDQFQSLSCSSDGPTGNFNQFGEGPSTQ